MKKQRAKQSVAKTVARPVTIKFKMKSGEIVSIRALRTFAKNGSARPRKG